VPASVGSEPFDSPLSVIAILGELDPAVSSSAFVGWSNVDQDGSFVAGVDDIVAGCSTVVVPFEFELLRLAPYMTIVQQVRRTLSPPLTSRVLAVAALLTLQVMDLEVTSRSGLLFGGERI
jgi:hypothetical protein